MPLHVRVRPLRILLPLAALVMAVAAPTAGAGVLASQAVDTSTYTFQQPFLPWGDDHQYTLAPGASFETSTWATGWTLSGGATRVAGNESSFVRAKSDGYSLSLPSGSSATTRPMSVKTNYPFLRFFMRNTGASTSTLQVEVLWEDLAGGQHAIKLDKRLTATSAWQVSDQISILMNSLAKASTTGKTAVAFRFTPLGCGGKWQIDDVYVDPYKR